jgi:TPR repeat protein
MKNSLVLLFLAFLSSSCLKAMEADTEEISSSYSKMREDDNTGNYYHKKQVKRELFRKHESTRKVSKDDEAKEYYKLGMEAIENKSYRPAFYYLKLAARLRGIDARYNLGVLYEFGLGTKMDLKKASDCYTSALGHEKSHEALSRVIVKQERELETRSDLFYAMYYGFLERWRGSSEEDMDSAF